MTKILRTEIVMLQVTTPVELGDFVMPIGSYRAIRRQIGFEEKSRARWRPATYEVEFSGRELAGMGAAGKANVVKATYDVTSFVHSGDITVG